MATEGSRLAVIAAFLANLAIAVAKFVAAALTGSAAMLSESYHSLADTGNQGMLLFGMRQAGNLPMPTTRLVAVRSPISGASWWRSCCSPGERYWRSDMA